MFGSPGISRTVVLGRGRHRQVWHAGRGEFCVPRRRSREVDVVLMRQWFHWEQKRGTYPERPGSRSRKLLHDLRSFQASTSRRTSVFVKPVSSSNPFAVQGRYPDAWSEAIREPSSTNSVWRENGRHALLCLVRAGIYPHLARNLQRCVAADGGREAMQFDAHIPRGEIARGVITITSPSAGYRDCTCCDGRRLQESPR